SGAYSPLSARLAAHRVWRRARSQYSVVARTNCSPEQCVEGRQAPIHRPGQKRSRRAAKRGRADDCCRSQDRSAGLGLDGKRRRSWLFQSIKPQLSVLCHGVICKVVSTELNADEDLLCFQDSAAKELLPAADVAACSIRETEFRGNPSLTKS